MDQTIYKLLLWSLPILLSILAFIGGLAVNALIKLADDVSEIKTALQVEITKRDALEKRVEQLEEKMS